MSNLVTHLTDAAFPAAIASGATLVDFWAPWCGPCKALAPVLEELAKDLEGTLAISKINVDEQPATAEAYGIQSIPTLILFKDGKPLGKAVGALPKASLKGFLSEHLGNLVS